MNNVSSLSDRYWNKPPKNPETTLLYEKENKAYRSMTHIHTIALIRYSDNTFSIDMIYANIRIDKDGNIRDNTFAFDRTGAIIM